MKTLFQVSDLCKCDKHSHFRLVKSSSEIQNNQNKVDWSGLWDLHGKQMAKHLDYLILAADVSDRMAWMPQLQPRVLIMWHESLCLAKSERDL